MDTQPDSEYSESSTVTFEWTLRGLRSLFDSTKGDKKSKVSKSVRFGNNRWQILFYANAGQIKEGTEGGFVSLYLSCEPTQEEKEASLGDSGRWTRDGVYKFSFELRSLTTPPVVYNAKEAQNHSFTWKTANWGWAQFARRDAVFYNSMPAKSQDGFLIVCNITSTPAKPVATPAMPRQSVPKSLMDTFGSLLDDPRYSDILFVIPKRGKSLNQGHKIWASKRVLERAEYFHTMLNSTFSEGVNELDNPNQTPRSMNQRLRKSPPQMSLILDEFEDSDDESEETDQESPPINDFLMQSGPNNTYIVSGSTQSNGKWDHVDQETPTEDGYKNQYAKRTSNTPSDFGNPKTTVVVKDAAYITYRAMLYYLYTDSIVFAPLSTSFLAASSGGTPATISVQDSVSVPSTPSEGSQISGTKQFMNSQDPCLTRADWIKSWMSENPGRPAPCSAKSIYRIADRLDLTELKAKAEKFIVKSLTVENIAYEVFSPFAAAFESIRKVEIEFFLSHWHEIRTSNTMKNVWIQIRNGRHPGFEDVWPLIVQNLDFKPSSPEPATSKSKIFEGWT